MRLRDEQLQRNVSSQHRVSMREFERQVRTFLPNLHKGVIQTFWRFRRSRETSQGEFYDRISFLCRPVGVEEVRHRKESRFKAVTMLWTVQLFKKIIEVEGANLKPFLPAIRWKLLASRKEVLFEMCHWPMCVTARTGNVTHQHAYELHDLDGKCKGCKNYLNFKTEQGTFKRTCNNDHYKGKLPCLLSQRGFSSWPPSISRLDSSSDGSRCQSRWFGSRVLSGRPNGKTWTRATRSSLLRC